MAYILQKPARGIGPVIAALLFFLPQFALAATIVLTSGSSWTVPANWNSSSNTIEAIGAGGGGTSYPDTAGGGGAYAKISNVSLTPGASVSYSVGAGGAGVVGNCWYDAALSAQYANTIYSCDSNTYYGAGGNGGATYFLNGSTLYAQGGIGAGSIQSADSGNWVGGPGGSAGSSVGTVRYSGGAGGNNPSYTSNGAGGGGAGGPNGNGSTGGDSYTLNGNGAAGGAGGGGYAGAGGTGGYGSDNYSTDGSAGGNYGGGGGGAGYGGGTSGPPARTGGAGASGAIIITYNPVPTCSVSFDQNPIAYGNSTTVHWTSANATSMTLTTIGPVTANQSGSTSVQPTATTNYTGTVVGSGGSATCPATLTVTPPSNPTATITSSLGSTVQIGQSTTITAHFTAGSGDSLTHDNIDSPVGTGLGATTNPDPIKLYTFTPTTPGTYTFYARAQTSYFTSWTTYASVTVTVPTPPACTVAFNQNPIAQGQSATVSWTSSNATSFSINTIGSVTPNTPGSTSVSPAQSTDYTGTAIGTGGTTNCHANTGTPPGTLNVSCTPSYTCSGNNIRYTNASCSVATTATCTAPAFCSTGSSICLYPPPSFNQSDGLTGHLEVHPSIVPQGQTTTVSWNVSNVSSCSVAGTNGDSFSGLSGNHTSGNILQQTTYTLTCAGLDGSTVNESQVVNVLPAFEEN